MMTLGETLVLLITIFFSVWLVIEYAQRIGEQQKREWIEFKLENPHLFRPQVSKSHETSSFQKAGMSETQKIEFVKNLWKDHPQKEVYCKNENHVRK